MIKKYKILIIPIVLMTLFEMASVSVYAVRIKDIADIQGVSQVQVIGYGLVTGLNNTGDNQQASFTVQSVSNMLKRFGLTVPQTNPRVRNVAAVMVTANIPNFLKPGSKIDVQVSSIGDASSLQGGVLLMTPLSTSNGEILGLAQGALSVGGYDYQSLGSRVSRNFVTVGRVPNGLILEKEVKGEFIKGELINIVMREPDFTTALNIANAINNLNGLTNTATPIDAANVQVQFPAGQNQMQIIQNISLIESANVNKDNPAKVVINERTGTIVIGGNVQLLPSVVAHGGLEIQIQRQVIVPQPAPFTIRPPSVAESAELTAEEDMNQAYPLNPAVTATVQDIATALNTLQVKPRDLITIFQALKEAGVLQAELVIQ